VLAALAAPAAFAQAPIVNPGAPGTEPRLLAAEEAIALARTAYTAADVRFLQAMIPHHRQAIEMATLAKDRTNRKELLDAAGRIDASQKDEIEFMRDWLAERNEPVEPAPAMAHGATDHAAHGADHAGGAHTAASPHALMKGMATPEQMAGLAAARGTEFDRLFLELMIKHHEGTVKMVEELLEQPGSAYEPALFEFTRDVTNDQNAEIERMNALLATLSEDPRAHLAAGFADAGEAILNLKKIASLPKPPGFVDPDNPAGLSPKRLAALAAENERRRRRGRDDGSRGGASERSPQRGSTRAPATRPSRGGSRHSPKRLRGGRATTPSLRSGRKASQKRSAGSRRASTDRRRRGTATRLAAVAICGNDNAAQPRSPQNFQATSSHSASASSSSWMSISSYSSRRLRHSATSMPTPADQSTCSPLSSMRRPPVRFKSIS
jgi:uncharacterized protein (DUF305 family)